MEYLQYFGIIIAIAVGWAILRFVLSAGARTAAAAGRAATGQGTFSENMDLAFKGMGPLEIKFHDTRLGDDRDGPKVKEIHAKGLFPLSSRTRVAFVTSVFDHADGEHLPVISILDALQESDSIVFQNQTEMPAVSPDEGFLSWVRVGGIIPELLQPPFSGTRQLVAVVRLIDLDHPPLITHGFVEDEGGVLWQRTLSFTQNYKEKGYQEASEHREEAQAISIKIAVAVAMADGSFDDREGEVIADWIKRAIEPFSGDKQEQLKKVYNDALRESFAAASSGSLTLSDLTAKLNEIGETKIKYDAIDLCFDVMAADGQADPEEMRMLRKVGEALDLDVRELEALRDQKIVGLDGTVSRGGSIEDVLGIEPDWDRARINAFLRAEFQKWNNRLSALPEGDERNNAQTMLDLIAKARQKYAGKH